jgi:hypothetical protein
LCKTKNWVYLAKKLEKYLFALKMQKHAFKKELKNEVFPRYKNYISRYKSKQARSMFYYFFLYSKPRVFVFVFVFYILRKNTLTKIQSKKIFRTKIFFIFISRQNLFSNKINKNLKLFNKHLTLGPLPRRQCHHQEELKINWYSKII